MKKRDLLFAGALLLGFGLNASAQEAPESQMFFFGFEDGLESFTDSSKPAEVITGINYYAGDPTSVGWEIVAHKDSVMNLLNGISPANRSGERDVVTIITEDPVDPSDASSKSAHQAEFEEMGAQGGNNYLKWQTAGAAGGSDCNDYEANLFIRGLKIEDYTSYRLVFYLKSAAATGNVQAGIFRGQYNSEKPISRDGASGHEFILEIKEFKNDVWERQTLMSYYQNDSVANNHMYKAGYWWTGSWTLTEGEGDDAVSYNYIEQFDTYFVRFAFRSPGSVFYVDDIALYKSWIGGAECNADIIRIDFGYQTNLADLAKADPNGAIKLPGDYFSVTGIDPDQGEDPIEIKVLSAEYHTDGYLYMWLEDECSYYSDIKVNFTNPVDDPTLALKYTGSLYPKALDQEWVDAGKLVPDFENEFVLPNPDVFATSLEFLPPTVASSEPENGSFNLDPSMKEVSVTFSKEIFVDIAAGVNTNGVLAQLQSAAGKEYWLPTAYDEDTYTVTFTRQNNTALKGDYDFVIMNMRAGEEESYEAAEPYTIQLSFGDLTGGAPEIYYSSETEWTKDGIANECVPLGWTVTDANAGSTPQVGTGEKKSGQSRMYYFNAGGAFTRGMYLCPRGTSVDAAFTYGETEGYALTLKPGDYWLSFKAFGWDGTCDFKVFFYPAGAEEKGDAILSAKTTKSESNGNAKSGYTVNGVEDAFRCNITVETEGNYVLQFFIDKSKNWGANVFGAIEFSNQYSSAYKYLMMIDEAYANAQAIEAKAQAEPNYTGADLDEFSSIIKSYEGFKSTSPTDYENAAQALKDATLAMNNRIASIDNYFKSYAAGEAKIAATDSIYGKTAANEALKSILSKYADFNVTVNTVESIDGLKKMIDDAVKAVDTRVSNVEAFQKELGEDVKVIEDENALKMFAEFAALVETYNANKDLDYIAAEDSDITNTTDLLTGARRAYNFKVSEVGAKTIQLKALAELAESFDVDFGEATADIAAKTAAALDDDQELCNIYKLAIKAKIYEQIAAGELDPSEENIELYPFITNYALYNVMPKEEMEYYYYSYSGVYRYRLYTDKKYENNVFPGWTVSGVFGSAHVGSEGRNWNTDAPCHDAGLSCDWTSGATVAGTISGLPVGIYSIGADVKHGVDNCTFKVTVPEGIDSTMTMAKETGVLTMDEVLLPAGEADIKYTIGSGSGWDYIYGFAATMTGISDDFAYDEAAADVQAELNGLVTIVPATKENAAAKYYNLNGVEVKNPNGIAIRVIDGKAQKVLVK